MLPKRLVRTLCLALLISVASALVPKGVTALGLSTEGSLCVESTQSVTFDVYRLVDAVGTQDGLLAKLSWSEGVDSDSFVRCLEELGYEADAEDRENVQSAVEWVGAQVDGPWAHVNTVPVGIAGWALGSLEPCCVVKPGERVALPCGWYLVLTSRSATAGKDAAGTSPILVAVVGDVTVSEKAELPTLAKEVMEDSTMTWGAIADAQVRQDVWFHLVATMPDELAAYENYRITFIDDLDWETDIDVSSVRVHSGGVDVTGLFDVTYDDGRQSGERVLLVSCDDVAELSRRFHVEDRELVVTYCAALQIGAATGTDGAHVNRARLAFTNDPTTEVEGLTAPVMATVLTYQYEAFVYEAGTTMPIPGVEIAIQNEDGTYIQADGTNGPEPYIWVTDEQGRIAVSGLDEGVYKGLVVSIPPGWNSTGSSFPIIIESQLSAYSASVLSASTEYPATLVGVRSNDGMVTMSLELTRQKVPVVPDDPKKVRKIFEELAQTGRGPLGILLVVGGAALAVAGIGLCRSEGGEHGA